jgi:hypothetical protein
VEELQSMDFYHSVRESKSTSSPATPPPSPNAPKPIKLTKILTPALNTANETTPAAPIPIKSTVTAPTQATGASAWSCEEVLAWMSGVGLERHSKTIRDHDIRGRLLLQLDHDDLLELGVASRLERKRILVEIEVLT